MLLISGVIMTGLVTWIGMNDWNIEKSFEKVGEQMGLVNGEKTPEVLEKVETPEEVQDEKKLDEEEEPEPALAVDGGGYIIGQELPLEPTYIDGILLASKKYPLSESFAPGESKEAREKFEELAAESALSGFKLTAFSTYRSFEYQTGLYERYVANDGSEKADRYSARPGYSEHQTGLAFDIGEVDQQDLWLTAEFGESEAGKWLAANAHRYGFIMRYPLGKEEITGYMYESWHFRYVGTEIAEKIYNERGTLEEYLGIN